MNRYGSGPGLRHKKRAYLVEADCHVRVGFYARTPEEAEDLFGEYCQAVEDGHPEIVLGITDLYEDE